MARPLPSSFAPLTVSGATAPNKPIIEGSSGSHIGPLDLAENIHYLWAEGHRPIYVTSHFNPNSTGLISGNGSGSEVIQGIWTKEPAREPYTSYAIAVTYENTGTTAPTHNGVARFDLGSDPWVTGAPPTGTFVDITLTANTGKWGTAVGVLTIDNSQTTDTIRMWLINGSSGTVRVHSVTIQPLTLTSIPAGSVTPSDGNGHRFVPHDDTELDADSPLSVHQMNTMLANLETTRKTRPDTIVSYCSDPSATGRAALETTETAYTTVARIPFFSSHGQTAIRWSVIGKRDGSVGSVRLSTGYMTTQSIDPEEVTLGSTWTSPYSSATTLWSDGSHVALQCAENSFDWLEVELKGDASGARLYGLCAWFEPVA